MSQKDPSGPFDDNDRTVIRPMPGGRNGNDAPMRPTPGERRSAESLIRPMPGGRRGTDVPAIAERSPIHPPLSAPAFTPPATAEFITQETMVTIKEPRNADQKESIWRPETNTAAS